MKNKIFLLGISGSLRENATNTNVLKAISTFLPEHVEFRIYEGLDQMPHFNPGNEENAAVKLFKQEISQASGVIFSTPEYAFGIPGVLKNALEWTVSSGEFNDKSVAAISASPLNSGGDKALASLLLTLTALGTRKNENSALSIPNIKMKLNGQGQLTDQYTLKRLEIQLMNLLSLIAAGSH